MAGQNEAEKKVILHENICCMCKPNTHRADFVSYLGFFSSPLEARVKDCVEDVCTIYLPHNNQINAMYPYTLSGASAFWLCCLLLFSFQFVSFVIWPFLLSFGSNTSFFCCRQFVFTSCILCTAHFHHIFLLHISCTILSTLLFVMFIL